MADLYEIRLIMDLKWMINITFWASSELALSLIQSDLIILMTLIAPHRQFIVVHSLSLWSNVGSMQGALNPS